MPKLKVCRHEGCQAAPVDQAIYCATHLSVPHRCKVTRELDGKTQRCKKSAMLGLEVCYHHGGRFPGNRTRSAKAKTLTAMQRFVRPYEGDLDPISAFEMEFRRTMGRIAWYDEQLAALADAKDLVWGQTKEEETTAGEYPGTTLTYEAKANIFEEMQRWERGHLLNMEKIWIGAGLEQQKISLLQTYAEKAMALTENALKALGLDTDDPKVREVMFAAFHEGDPSPILSPGRTVAVQIPNDDDEE